MAAKLPRGRLYALGSKECHKSQKAYEGRGRSLVKIQREGPIVHAERGIFGLRAMEKRVSATLEEICNSLEGLNYVREG
jgi:hypothetical protein